GKSPPLCCLARFRVEQQQLPADSSMAAARGESLKNQGQRPNIPRLGDPGAGRPGNVDVPAPIESRG
ncbi:MAG: hypothetical protein ACLQU5_05785, partial [Isosphaeraceae bacterium]